MSSRMGRPKVEKPKIVIAKARIDEETDSRLIGYCERNGTNRTEVIRKGIELVLRNTKE